MTTYRLASSDLVHAPGLIAWAINGYAFPKDRKAILNVVKAWNVPEPALKALLSRNAPYSVEGDVVVFDYAPGKRVPVNENWLAKQANKLFEA
jgi:hypothetical protein